MIESYELAGRALVLSAPLVTVMVLFLAISAAWGLGGGRSCG